MIPEELEKLIIRHKSEGHLPFFVNCTTGTTVYGAFDPVNPIADICERHNIWLHIDVRILYKIILWNNYIAQLIGKTFCNSLIVILIPSFHTFLIQAAWGGGLLMSRKYRQLRFEGIERYLNTDIHLAHYPNWYW